MCSGSVPGAWRMVRGRSQALHPGRSRFPGPTRHPQQVFGQCHGPMRPRDTKCVRIADLQIMAFSLPVMFGCHTRHFAFSLPVMFISRSRSGTPAHWPDVLGRCPWGLADGVRPLPSAASQPCSSPRAEISVCGIILTHCGVVDHSV